MSKMYNMSGKLNQAFERAIYLTEDFKSDEVCTVHMGLSILMDRSCCLQKLYLETGYEFPCENIVYEILGNDEIFEYVTGKKYPAEEEIDTEETQNEVEEDEKNLSNSESVDTQIQKQIIYFVDKSSFIQNIKYENIPYSSNLENAFEDAYQRCLSNGQDFIDEENLLYSILTLEDCSFKRLLEKFEFDISEFVNMLAMNATIYKLNKNNTVSIPETLKSCCEILNEQYFKGEECQILGRDKEIKQVWNIFSKKTKRNAILVGDAGVGKTAIVEAITIQIVNGKCPREFKNYKVVSLNLTGMVAGTKYRGEFELKIQHLIQFLKTTSNIIIFIDEIHQILGTGSGENSGPDLSGSLKPILARDDVVFIGSTTNIEYERYFAVDPAFKRRFEKISVKEPKLSEVKDMVALRVKSITDYHKVSMDDDVLNYAIITAKAMNYYGNNPDLTIDLVDRASAMAKLARRKAVKRVDVDKVFKANYDMFKSMKRKDKLSTAYHEAGHALYKLMSKYNLRDDLKIVSIIPTSDYLGATISEPNDCFAPVTRKAVMEKASMSLAGRVSQEFVSKDWDFGASSDLENATSIIRSMIIEMGMDNDIYTNISLYDYNSNGHNMSPAAVDKVNDRISEIMKKVYDDTKKFLTKNKDKLDIIVNLLMKKGIISVQEITEAFERNENESIKEC